LAIGVYGLTQALFQIPFGMLSDKIGRKPVITIGLLIFALGSVIAANSDTITGIIIGRMLQGSGAIAAALMALLADSTREDHRTKAMSMIGLSIGMSFTVALMAGPILNQWIGVSGIFWLIAILALLGIAVLYLFIPQPTHTYFHRDTEPVPAQFKSVLSNRQLLRLDFGIFTLHMQLTAIFMVIPLVLQDKISLAVGEHWKIYLPVLLVSFMLMIPFIIIAEKKRQMKKVFAGAIITLVLANLGLFLYSSELLGLIGFLWLFFCGFNLLEATLPSLISKTAPGDLKGTAMGAYSSSQFMGAFVGGVSGGWLYGELGAEMVFLLCAVATSTWVIVALFMKSPKYLANLLISLDEITEEKGSEFVAELLNIVGVEDVNLHFEESVAYLKVDNKTLQKEDLQQLLNHWAVG